MKKQETMLKGRNGLSMNHNDTTLKVRKGLSMNHNESTLQARKGMHQNHNQAMLAPRKKVNMSQKIFAFVALLTLLFTQWGGAIGVAKAAQCTAAQGQLFIDSGQYKKAIQEFTCIIEAQPTEVEGYRGRIEAELLLGQYSNALADNGRITAFVLPLHPDAKNAIFAGYADRLAVAPQSITALTGASFSRWTSFDYANAIHLLNQLLAVQPNSPYGNLFRGSSRLLHHANTANGIADIEYGIALAPQSAEVRFIVADAYTYGLPDPERAFEEASLALNWGLDTPRVHAILATSYAAFGDQLAAAAEIQTHIELVTTEFLPASPINAGGTLNLNLVPGRTYDIPVAVTAGETLSIMTGSPDFWDSILVLLAPDGTPVFGSDDYKFYFAGFQWVATQTGTYHLQVTSFESIDTGELVVTRN
jgi:tetratricopeptide (TPR) repeat protein